MDTVEEAAYKDSIWAPEVEVVPYNDSWSILI